MILYLGNFQDVISGQDKNYHHLLRKKGEIMNRSYERVSTPEFPLREAYPYIIEHNLLNEEELIKNMKIDWEERETRIKRGRMIEVLEKNGLFNEFIDRVWIRGRTPEGQKK